MVEGGSSEGERVGYKGEGAKLDSGNRTHKEAMMIAQTRGKGVWLG